jgi:3-phenylpropionate/trans-cinnamate dioxygenase ferredoxin component
MEDGFIRAATLDDVAPGTLLAVELQGRRVCLANADGEIYAVQDNCTHKDFPLSAGELEDEQLTCAWHGARFDLATGRALCLPAVKPVRTYEVRVQDGEIFVQLESRTERATS